MPTSSSKLVVVLGCGPSGLLAAHAARLSGCSVTILSVKRPSPLFGCQYLHAQIPKLDSGDPHVVSYQLRGTPGEYADKVYGADNLPASVSPEELPGEHLAWDIRTGYVHLWEKYQHKISDVRLQASDIAPMLDYYSADVTINTVPMPLICENPMHNFKSTKCWAVGDAPVLGQIAPSIAPPFTVICDGTKDQGYYRASNVFGYQTVEWPGWKRKPPVAGVVDFLKPLATDCNCWPTVTRVGRMGKWQKGVLAHHAFEEALKAVNP